MASAREGNPRDIRSRRRPGRRSRDRSRPAARCSAASSSIRTAGRNGEDGRDRQRETIAAIGKSGCAEWISAVKTHHSATFRHCLLVNGLAVAFAQSLGFRHDDVLQLSVASALHDIGKAQDSAGNPGQAGAPQRQRGQDDQGPSSPRTGDAACSQAASPHRHGRHRASPRTPRWERLSPRPEGAEIPDLTQLVTIVDIFSALIEPRTYKATMSRQEAYGILQGMHGKLDPALLEAFAPVVAACPESGALAIPA